MSYHELIEKMKEHRCFHDFCGADEARRLLRTGGRNREA